MNAEYQNGCISRRSVSSEMLPQNRESNQSSSRTRFLVNAGKSNLVPSQDLTYIGRRVLLDKGIVLPTVERISKLQVMVKGIMAWSGIARQYL